MPSQACLVHRLAYFFLARTGSPGCLDVVVNAILAWYLRGDGKASWQTMVEVIDIVERAGIWTISFATQKPRPN